MWIWTNGSTADVANQYAEFRFSLDLKQPVKLAALRISVDTDFAVWVNGAFVSCGQFTDFPDRRTFSELDLSTLLQSGKNSVAILVFYCGEDHFSYLPGPAGLWFEVEVEGRIAAVSDGSTLCRPSPAYLATQTARIDAQRAFTFHYDATRGDSWTAADYVCGRDWTNACVRADQGTPSRRPLKMLDVKPRAAASIVAQGILKRTDAPKATIAELMQHDFLSARRSWELFKAFESISTPASFPVTITPANLDGAEGAYVIIDLGREECGFPAIELNASSRCTIDIAVGEHLDDLRVRSHIGGRNFASRYIARPGTQTFVHHVDRYAGRYVQLHITDLQGDLELRYAGLVPAEYPVQFAGGFESVDALGNQIWHTSTRTLHLCMFEHYEDCPWREQGLYANDSRNQMLAGYYAFGNYDFARVSLELLARSTGEDGFQELCAPMKCPITIPSFTLTWFLAMNDYLMYSGDRDFIASEMPRIKRMLNVYLSSLKEDLLPCPPGKRYWHFYDWAPGLDGTDDADCRNFHAVGAVRFDAPLNLFLILVLQAVANMAEHTGDDALRRRCLAEATKLRSAVHRRFWNAKAGAYQTYVTENKPLHLAELTQSLAILADVGDEALRHGLREKLMSDDNGWVTTTLSQSFYKFEALLLDPASGVFVRERISRDWSKMLFAGATTFWETLSGGWDFHHAGSLCHGWSGTPVYFYGAYGLGIKPKSPGFAQVSFKPMLDMTKISGVVPSPRGEIRIASRAGADAPEIKLPHSIEMSR